MSKINREGRLFFILSLHCLERKAQKIGFNNKYKALIFHN